MPKEAKTQKTLRLKLAFVVILAILSPLLLGIFLHLDTILLIAISTICAFISVVTIFLLLKPLDTLIKSAAIFSTGNLNQRINIKSGDEFGDIASSFNYLADRLSKYVHGLEGQQTITVAEKDKLNQILSSVIDGIIALDFNKNIIFVNKASEEITGFTQKEMWGKPLEGMVHFFSGTDEIIAKSYCQNNFNQSAMVIGKNAKQTKINLITAQVGAVGESNISCILILHDLSKEEELEQMKLDFVSMASHELKTPLTSIVGYLSVFIDENKDKITPDDLDLLNKAYISSRQLQTLISNLLNVNKIEKQQMSVSPQALDYLPIITKAIDDLRSQANQKNIVLSLQPVPQNLPKVFADPMRIGEVVTNLISNAINYTDNGGSVSVSLNLSPTEVTTSVTDTGVGIPKEAISHLFHKFYRASNKLQQASKGTGLGLYISKSIIEKLHGKIWVESEMDKGSRFSFTLPVVTQNTTVINQDQFTSSAIQSGALNY